MLTNRKPAVEVTARCSDPEHGQLQHAHAADAVGQHAAQRAADQAADQRGGRATGAGRRLPRQPRRFCRNQRVWPGG
jgi:hypothetical protein